MEQKNHLNTLSDTMNDNDVIRPSCIKLSQMTRYVRTFFCYCCYYNNVYTKLKANVKKHKTVPRRQ